MDRKDYEAFLSRKKRDILVDVSWFLWEMSDVERADAVATMSRVLRLDAGVIWSEIDRVSVYVRQAMRDNPPTRC